MALTTGDGLPLAATVHSASPGEVTLIEGLLQQRVLKRNLPRLIYDRAADSDPLRVRLTLQGTELICPHRKNRKKPPTQDGRKLNVVALPTPGWVGDEEGRLPASYANFYISNTKVLVPIFGQPNDARAVEVIQSVFPTRKAVGLMAKHLVYGLGTFHCMSQQQPGP